MVTRIQDVLGKQVLIADGAMGTMLQSYTDLTLDGDFQGLEGCNEILNATRPDVIGEVHRVYLDAGADCIETNTFGTNLAALREYDIVERLEELAEAGARIARAAADEYTDKPRFVLGAIGPGTKLPTLGHVRFAELRDAYQLQVDAMIRGGIDAVLIETAQDLLQAKAAVIAAKRARAEADVELPILVNVTVETTGTMLLGSEIGAALITLDALGVDSIGLNCATGPAEMSEHLRHLSRRFGRVVAAMPNAGLPELTADGAVYPLGAEGLADALGTFLDDYGLGLIGGCCGTTPEHIKLLVDRFGGRDVAPREPQPEEAVSSLYLDVPLGQDTSYLSIGERTNANGSKAFREAMLAGNLDECVEIAKAQARDGAHVLDLCIDYVGRDGVADMEELASRLATSVTLPIVLDSTEPEVLR
ncbi:MAG: dihydropteroate synthase, partial [Propionibacterium sp.]|nr:dihydropteroate synthase [Propionibacterium sp.]